MYHTVLIPTDGSDGSLAAGEVGLELAAEVGAVVHALYVVDERRVLDGYDLAIEAAEEEAERALDDVEAAGKGHGIDVQLHLRQGVPHVEILDAIDDYGADLVVMGTHGRSGLDRWLHLGSTTARVVRGSPVQVLTVPLRG